MKLKEYLEKLNALVKKDSSLLDVDLYSSSDDEGNSYNSVWTSPAVYYASFSGRYLDYIMSEKEAAKEGDNSLVKILLIN